MGADDPTTEVESIPMPKSPLAYPDLCGKHRLQVEVQMMDREIGFLEEELNSLFELQPASRCCQEVYASVETNPDPLLLLDRKTRKTGRLCRCIRWMLCLDIASSSCCFRESTPKSKKPRCCGCCKAISCCCPPRFSCLRQYSCGCVLSCRNNGKDSCFCRRCSGPCCMCQCLCP